MNLVVRPVLQLREQRTPLRNQVHTPLRSAGTIKTFQGACVPVSGRREKPEGVPGETQADMAGHGRHADSTHIVAPAVTTVKWQDCDLNVNALTFRSPFLLQPILSLPFSWSAGHWGSFWNWHSLIIELGQPLGSGPLKKPPSGSTWLTQSSAYSWLPTCSVSGRPLRSLRETWNHQARWPWWDFFFKREPEKRKSSQERGEWVMFAGERALFVANRGFDTGWLKACPVCAWLVWGRRGPVLSSHACVQVCPGAPLSVSQ